jgi:hypothetical protein
MKIEEDEREKREEKIKKNKNYAPPKCTHTTPQ